MDTTAGLPVLSLAFESQEQDIQFYLSWTKLIFLWLAGTLIRSRDWKERISLCELHTSFGVAYRCNSQLNAYRCQGLAAATRTQPHAAQLRHHSGTQSSSPSPSGAFGGNRPWERSHATLAAVASKPTASPCTSHISEHVKWHFIAKQK